MAKCFLLVINFVCLCYTLTASEFFFPPENKYRVHINWPGPGDAEENEDPENVVFMTSVDQERYKCILPSLKEGDETDGSHGKSDQYKGETPLELLKPIFSQLICALKIEAYWVYELCHGYYIRQFHEENSGKGKVKLQYILGKFDVEKAFADERSKDEESRPLNLPTIQVEDTQLPYFAINMTDGTFCEISGKKRFTRVLYVCSHRGNNAIYSLKETSSCEYEIVVLTNVLCIHPAFRKKYFTETSVYCRPLSGSPTRPKRLDRWEEVPKSEPFKPFSGTATLEHDPEEQKVPEEKELPKEKVPKEDKKTEKDTSKEDTSKEKTSVNPVPPGVVGIIKSTPHDDKLIDDLLHGRYCLRGGSGWWQYEFCYGKLVKQYHVNEDGSRITLMLGVWNTEKHLQWVEEHPTKRPKKSSDKKQVSHFYSEGQYCDETGKPRQVEVKLRCVENIGHPDAVALYLLEPKICEYVLIVESPVFCSVLDEFDDNGLNPELY